MNYPVPDGKYRIMIAEKTSFGSSSIPIDIADIKELKEHLTQKGVIKFSLRSNDIIDDNPSNFKLGISIDELTPDLFNWLVQESYGSSKFLQIDTKRSISKQKKNNTKTRFTFKRRISNVLINRLLNEQLYNKALKNDIYNKLVFPAIRNNRIDFYHKGGKLFQYDNNGFKTHIKYAAVIEKRKRDYLTEKELHQFKLASNFLDNYKRIKENCSNYSGIEAIGVSTIYHRFPYIDKDSEIVVLDIEPSFHSLNTDKKQDRFDLLIYNTREKKLQFIEAKHYSNSEIWSKQKAEVIRQIEKYEKQINRKKSNILAEYINYIDIVNNLFGTKLPEPLDIDDKVTLLIFGFDNDQKKGRLKTFVTKNPYFEGVKNYNIGNVDKIVIEHLWNAKCIKK